MYRCDPALAPPSRHAGHRGGESFVKTAPRLFKQSRPWRKVTSTVFCFHCPGSLLCSPSWEHGFSRSPPLGTLFLRRPLLGNTPYRCDPALRPSVVAGSVSSYWERGLESAPGLGQLTNRERFPVFFTFQPFRLDFVGPLRSRSAANPMKFVPLPFRSFGVLLQAASLPFSFPHTRETSLRRLRPIALRPTQNGGNRQASSRDSGKGETMTTARCDGYLQRRTLAYALRSSQKAIRAKRVKLGPAVP